MQHFSLEYLTFFISPTRAQILNITGCQKNTGIFINVQLVIFCRGDSGYRVKYCPVCGTKNGDEKLWCIKCDTKLEEKSLVAGVTNNIHPYPKANPLWNKKPHKDNISKRNTVLSILAMVVIGGLIFLLSWGEPQQYIPMLIGSITIWYAFRSLKKGYTEIAGSFVGLPNEFLQGIDKYLENEAKVGWRLPRWGLIKKDKYGGYFYPYVFSHFLIGIFFFWGGCIEILFG